LDLVGLDCGQPLDSIDDLFFDVLDAFAYLLVTYREEQDHDQQTIEKDEQEHKSPLAAQAQLVLQAGKPFCRLRVGGLEHSVLDP
jgi:hypothetical protein